MELKLLPADDLRDPETALRIRREVAVLTRLKMGRIWAVGHVDDPPFIVMEHIPGRSLAQWLVDLGKFGTRDSVNLILQVLEAVAAMHEAGVLHRDIQPDHVLIGDEGRVVLRGFGFVKLTDLDDGDGTLTRNDHPYTRAALYKAPEQLFGDGDVCTPATDLYSVGLTLYCCIAGRLPFDGTPLEQVISRVDLAPPSLIERNASVPEPVSDLVARMLAPEPSNRPQTATEVSSVLKCWADFSFDSRGAAS